MTGTKVSFTRKIKTWWQLQQLKSADYDERQKAEQELIDLKNPQAVAPLLEMFKEADFSLRETLEKILPKICDESSFELLAAALTDANFHPDNRKSIAKVLGETGNILVAEPLTGALRDVNASVRPYAAQALCKVLKLQSADTLRSPELSHVVKPLIDYANILTDETVFVYAPVTEVLEMIGDTSVVNALIHILNYKSSPTVQRDAAYALGKIGDARAVDPLLKMLVSYDATAYKGAAETLHQLGYTGTIEPLDGVIIIFDKDFSPKETFIESILTKMSVNARKYDEWMTTKTPRRVLVDPNARDPMKFTAVGAIEFRRMIGERFDFDKLEYATFEGTEGISGVILTHWNHEELKKHSWLVQN